MPKATIKSKTGSVITIEGSQSEISNILATLERGTPPTGKPKEGPNRGSASRKGKKKRVSVPDLVLELKDKSFFDKPKSLGDVAAALEQQGYLHPVTSLSGVMLGLLKKRQLSRKKV